MALPGTLNSKKPHKLPMMYWLPKLHKRPYKARFIANSSSTTELSSCLTAVKSRVIRYYATVYERSRKNMFCPLKESGEVLSKLKSRGFRATSLSTYDLSTLYTTLSHNIIKETLLDFIERAFKKFYKNEGTLYLACNDKKAFFTSTDHRGINFGLVRMYVMPYRIFWIIFTSDLVISYIDKMLVFRWIHIVPLLKPICFHFAMKKIS